MPPASVKKSVAVASISKKGTRASPLPAQKTNESIAVARTLENISLVNVNTNNTHDSHHPYLPTSAPPTHTNHALSVALTRS